MIAAWLARAAHAPAQGARNVIVHHHLSRIRDLSDMLLGAHYRGDLQAAIRYADRVEHHTAAIARLLPTGQGA